MLLRFLFGSQFFIALTATQWLNVYNLHYMHGTFYILCRFYRKRLILIWETREWYEVTAYTKKTDKINITAHIGPHPVRRNCIFLKIQPPIGLCIHPPFFGAHFTICSGCISNNNSKCTNEWSTGCVFVCDLCLVVVVPLLGFSGYTHNIHTHTLIILNMYEIYIFCSLSLLCCCWCWHSHRANTICVYTVQYTQHTKYEWIIYILQITKTRIKSKHSQTEVQKKLYIKENKINLVQTNTA